TGVDMWGWGGGVGGGGPWGGATQVAPAPPGAGAATGSAGVTGAAARGDGLSTCGLGGYGAGWGSQLKPVSARWDSSQRQTMYAVPATTLSMNIRLSNRLTAVSSFGGDHQSPTRERK